MLLNCLGLARRSGSGDDQAVRGGVALLCFESAVFEADLGFHDARPDLPQAWVAEIVRVAHARGLKVTAHSYGEQGDWAAIRGGVDGIEHLVNVPHELSDEMIEAIVARGIWVTPTLAGSAYGVMTMLRDPSVLYSDADVVANVSAPVRQDLYRVLRFMRLPGLARVALGQRDPMGKLELWYKHSLANTAKLYRTGVKLAFGSDVPFVFGNFFHTVMTEARAPRRPDCPTWPSCAWRPRGRPRPSASPMRPARSNREGQPIVFWSKAIR